MIISSSTSLEVLQPNSTSTLVVHHKLIAWAKHKTQTSYPSISIATMNGLEVAPGNSVLYLMRTEPSSSRKVPAMR